MRFSRQEYWSGLPFPSPGDLPNPGIDPRSPALQADSLPAELQGSTGKPVLFNTDTHISNVYSIYPSHLGTENTASKRCREGGHQFPSKALSAVPLGLACWFYLSHVTWCLSAGILSSSAQPHPSQLCLEKDTPPISCLAASACQHLINPDGPHPALRGVDWAEFRDQGNLPDLPTCEERQQGLRVPYASPRSYPHAVLDRRFWSSELRSWTDTSPAGDLMGSSALGLKPRLRGEMGLKPGNFSGGPAVRTPRFHC